MGISIERLTKGYPAGFGKTQAHTTSEKAVSGRQFDEISISSNGYEQAQAKVAEQLTKSVLQETIQTTPQEKVDTLKQVVSQGLYQVDLEAVAAKMMRLGE